MDAFSSQDIAPTYLNQLVPVSDLPCRYRLRSSTLELFIPSYRLTTIGHRSFPVAAAIIWNTLPVHVQSSPSIATFCQRLKTFFLTVILQHYHLTLLNYVQWWFKPSKTGGAMLQSPCGLLGCPSLLGLQPST